MPIIERSEIMTQLISSCTFPKPTELDDHTCHICQEPSLGPRGNETPIKLRCGHVLGMACLATWAFRQIEEVENRFPGCPLCRAPLLNSVGSNTAFRIESEENEVNIIWLPALASWSPGHDDQYGQLDDDADSWIERAEQLWDDLCKQILDDLDDVNFTYGRSGAVEGFICGNAVVAEQFLSFGTVFHFYQYYSRPNRPRYGWHSWDESFTRNFPLVYKRLINHLKTASTVMLDEDNWRVWQAFKRPQNQLDIFYRRMEQSRANLSKRVEEAKESRR